MSKNYMDLHDYQVDLTSIFLPTNKEDVIDDCSDEDYKVASIQAKVLLLDKIDVLIDVIREQIDRNLK